MSNITPNPKKRSYLLPAGCKDLIDVLHGVQPKPPLCIKARVNGKIRAREMRVVGEQGRQIGIMSLIDALCLAQKAGLDLVEIAPRAKPPVCMLVDFGKLRYELTKKWKKHK